MKPAHRMSHVREVKNMYQMLGIDLHDLSQERPWTPDGDRALIDFYQKGLTVDVMAEIFKRSTDNVAMRIIYLGERGKISPEMWGCRAKGPVPKGPLGVRG